MRTIIVCLQCHLQQSLTAQKMFNNHSMRQFKREKYFCMQTVREVL